MVELYADGPFTNAGVQHTQMPPNPLYCQFRNVNDYSETASPPKDCSLVYSAGGYRSYNSNANCYRVTPQRLPGEAPNADVRGSSGFGAARADMPGAFAASGPPFRWWRYGGARLLSSSWSLGCTANKNCIEHVWCKRG